MSVQIRNFTHSYLSTAAQLTEKLKQLNSDSTITEALQEFADTPVKDVVVSDNHIALLLGNGYIYRLQYTMNSAEGNKDRNDDDGASTSSVHSGSRGASPRGDSDTPTSYFVQRFGPLARRGRAFSRRLIERRHDRLSRALLARVPSFVPAAEVPEDLVEEAMAVLQGKSREVVIRELQRTNLDVNTAVNNLLSRDEDDTHNDDDHAPFPSGEELLTLMGSGGLVDDDLDELLTLGRNRSEDPSGRGGREGRTPGMYNDPLVAHEIRSWVTLADRAATGNGSAPSSSTGHASSSGGGKGKGGGNTRKESSAGSSMYFLSKSCWRNDGTDKLFTHIAGLKSDLLAVDDQGVLYSWPWEHPLPPTTPHSRLAELGLQGERIRLLSAKILRASVVTESGKTATWLDSSVSTLGKILEHSAATFPELAGELIIQLVTCELFTAACTDSGKLMWWGVLPYTERRSLINQFQDKNRSSGGGSGLFGRGQHIQEGSRVCLRSRPIYSSGCRAIYVKGNTLMCGELQESVFLMSDKCRFKLLPLGGAQEAEPMDVEGEREGQPIPLIGSKRKRPSDDEGEDDEETEKPKEELWALRDVIFLCPPLSSAPTGRVIKLDGLYAAVLFPSLKKESPGENEQGENPHPVKEGEGESQDNSLLSQCRLLRRDDLVVISSDSAHPDPICVQATPKKIRLAGDSILLALTADSKGLHSIVANHGSVSLCSFNMETGRVSHPCVFPVSSANFLLQQVPPPGSPAPSLPMRLTSMGLSLWLLVDSLGGVYPLARDAVGGMRTLPLLNLPPVYSVVYTSRTPRSFLVTMAMQKQRLTPLLRNCSLNGLRNFLETLSHEDIELCLKELTHGGCNILHLLSTLSSPSPPTPSGPSFGASGSGSGRSRSGYPSLREIMHQNLNLPTASVVESRLWSVGMGEGEMDDADEPRPDKGDRSSVYVTLLHHLGTLASSFREVFIDLMTTVNLMGYTPFMAAVATKSYSAALEILNISLQLSDYQEDDGDTESLLLGMLFPSGSHCDDNPLFVLCRNDPCSFTWTGEEHIQQNIFECKTCGLVGSLCCCTECAYNCHRGHDCSFKRSSPNAYCDCWERCSCQALAAGDEGTRTMLLHRLLDLKFLSKRTNSSGEYLIGMLAAIVARQTKEQSQWSGKKPSHLRRSRNEPATPSGDVPVHFLSPPKFALKTIGAVLEDWPSVKAVLTCDSSNSGGLDGKSSVGGAGEWPFTLSFLEQQRILESQQSTRHLDVLVYTMLAKTSHQHLEALITTLVTQLGPNRDNPEALVRCQRLVRSVVRALVVCELEKMTGPESHLTSIRRKISVDGEHCFIYKEALFVLNSLAPLAIPELVISARGLILPVCMGVARPFLPNLMNDKHKIAEELFTLPPSNLFKQTKTSLTGHAAPAFGTASETGSTGGRMSTGRGGGVSDSDSEPVDGDDTHMLGDASSTATIGSGPLPFFSDQESSDGEDIESVDEDSLDGGDLEEGYSTLTIPIEAGSRVQATTHWAVPEMPGTSTGKKFSRTSTKDVISYGTSAVLLSRAFDMLIRLVADLMEGLAVDEPHPPFELQSIPTDYREVYDTFWTELDVVWQWLATIMDSTESQLRLGCALNATWAELAETLSKPSTSSSSGKSSDNPNTESRRGFLGYMLSLMRSETREHGGTLPSLDVGRLEYVAWAMDALMYMLMRVTPPTDTPTSISDNSGHFSAERRKFFRRSASTLCLHYPPPSPFAPLAETLPLAEKPHLLHPRQTKELLFGYGQQETLEVWPDTPIDPSPILPLIENPIPLKTSLAPGKNLPSKEASTSDSNKPVALSRKQVLCETNHTLSASVIMGRWCMSVELLSGVFVDTLGKQHNSIFSHLQNFENMERDIRREMDNLRAIVHRDLQLDVDRARELLIPSLFRQLNNQCEYRRVGAGNQPLCSHRIRVSFKNEPGEGSGVVRSFFTAAAEAFMSEEPLPELDYNVSINSRGMSLAEVIDEYTGKVDIECPNPASHSVAELCPLFFQPGKAGYYSIRVGSQTPARINAYRNVGRVIGLALLHSEMVPLPFCRHIYKYLLNRKISWHDMAFFDPVMYEGLRKLILSAHQDPDQIRNMELNWEVTLGEYEGGGTHALLATLSNKSVTTVTDVYEYVQKYSELRMLRVVEESLMAMRRGVYDVLPTYALDSLSPETMRLLLCGCQQVDLDMLKRITMFSDESKKGSDHIVRFKSWFWSIVERMSNREKQDLLYFWTSSPSMPANPDSYQPPPSITIRPADDQHLPTSNTCISRLYIPLYSSKALLRSKLLASIKIKAFGFI